MVTLTATNTYSGTTTISGGTLQLGTGAAGQDGSIGGTSGVTDNAMLVYNVAGSQTASYSIGGSGNLSMIGSGTLVLAGSNGYGAATTVSKGVLQIGNSAAFGASSSLSISAVARSIWPGTARSPRAQRRPRQLNHQQRRRSGDAHHE